MMRLRSTRRQRTTPSFSRSGPASTIVANSANCAADRRGFPQGRGTAPTIFNKINRKRLFPFDTGLYRLRNVIERT
jgi:hypothetical protein